MANLSQERIQEFKDLFEKEKGEEITWSEASEGANNLVGFYEILLKCHIEDLKLKEKLKELPDGFNLEGTGRTCAICGNPSTVEGSWYDKYGLKCLICQDSINRKEIPPSLAKNKESWYSKYDLESSFNLKGPTLTSWIKKGVIKARSITYKGKGVRTQLFLIKDNKDFLPPKNMVKSQLVKESKDGKNLIHLEPWYRFYDPREHLKGYKILDYLEVLQDDIVL